MIPDPPAIGLFVVAALALLLVPGPAVLYVVARSIQEGRRAGLVSVLGIHVGTLAHIAAATLGLSALVVSSAVAPTAVKIAGAVYLVGLGLWTLFSSRAESEVALGGGWIRDHRFSSQTMRRPSRVRNGSTRPIVSEWGATRSASPPVAIAGASAPSSARIRPTIPSTWPANP